MAYHLSGYPRSRTNLIKAFHKAMPIVWPIARTRPAAPSAVANQTTKEASPKESRPSGLFQVYIKIVIGLGFIAVLYALLNLPEDRLGLVLFSALAAIAELSNVELFSNSRSRVSVSYIIAISSILLFGPFAGSLTHMTSGIMTAITTSFKSQRPKKGRAPWLQRMAFNTGMFVIATALAGWVFVSTGGEVGHVWQLRNLLPLTLAATVNVLANIFILIGVITLQTGRSPLRIWEEDFSWSVPISVIGSIVGSGVLASAYDMFSVAGVAVFMLPILATSYSFRLYVANTKVYVDKLQDMNRSLGEVNLSLMETLGAVIDAYDVYTYGHSNQVALYAGAIAEKMNIPPDEQAIIVKAALVHDLGKVGILDSIVSKPEKLTDEEYNILRRHPLIGAQILGRTKGLQEVVPLVKYHHEHWDGGGYPTGLKGEAIPIGARILGLADALDAMLSDRPYRPTRSLNAVMEEIERYSGKQFDPKVAAAFFAVVREKGSDFFKNSAAIVDSKILVNPNDSSDRSARYLKNDGSITGTR
jgi:putative nucleotidyltransferase with HDIG domain